MFDRHRNDLKEAHKQTLSAMRDTILVQADMIDHLRAQLDGHAFISSRTPALNPAGMLSADAVPGDSPDGSRKYLTEEEEELLALQLNGHISELELAKLQEQLGMPHLKVAPDHPDDE